MKLWTFIVTKSTVIANGLSYKELINISCSDAKYSIVPLYCTATAHQNNHLLMWKWLAALNSLNKIIQQSGFKTDFIQITVNTHVTICLQVAEVICWNKLHWWQRNTQGQIMKLWTVYTVLLCSIQKSIQ